MKFLGCISTAQLFHRLKWGYALFYLFRSIPEKTWDCSKIALTDKKVWHVLNCSCTLSLLLGCNSSIRTHEYQVKLICFWSLLVCVVLGHLAACQKFFCRIQAKSFLAYIMLTANWWDQLKGSESIAVDTGIIKDTNIRVLSVIWSICSLDKIATGHACIKMLRPG